MSTESSLMRWKPAIRITILILICSVSTIVRIFSAIRYESIIHEFDHFQAQPWAVEQAKKNPKIRFLMEQTVKDFEGEESLTAVISEHKRTGEVTRTPVSGVFLFIGYVPNTGWLREKIDINERGEILTDESMKTSVAGVFAAGDARQKRYRQVTTAVSDGAIAAIAASEYVASLAA